MVPDNFKAKHNPLTAFQQSVNPGRTAAIKAMCAHCVGVTVEDVPKGFRQEIRDCSSYGCPLRRFRPYQKQEEETMKLRMVD
jgi:hypothetical protein